MPPRILFVCHSASRNGASILLLNLLRWLRKHTTYELEVLISGTGELVPEFRAVCKTKVWRDASRVLEFCPGRWSNSLRPRVRARSLELLTYGRKYDLVYFNTAAAAQFIPILRERAGSVLWHIHELEYALRLSNLQQPLEELLRIPNRLISVSKSVSTTLIERFEVPPERIDLVYGFATIPHRTAKQAAAVRERIRRTLGWPDDAFVVGGCGALGWRKGTDVFLQAARKIHGMRNHDSTRFLWVGGGTGTDEALRFKHDVRAFGLAGRCELVPDTASVWDYYLAMDVFALTSREDPFPLVMLEAGACNLPVVCFEMAGGAPEFVGADAGLVAPYLDTTTLASHIDSLRRSPELRRSLGAGAAEKVKAHHLVDTQATRVLASIDRCLSESLDGREAPRTCPETVCPRAPVDRRSLKLRSVLKRIAGPYGRLLVRRLRTKRYPIAGAYRKFLEGTNALEIGGPSNLLGYAGPLPIYSCLKTIDNCNYSERTLWNGDGVRFKRTLICEATELPVDDSSYGCIIASHCLEHMANPIRALLEWRRVLQDGGLLLLILPHRDFTFDWRRPVTSLEHLREDFERNTPETDLSHIEEILALHDLSRDVAAGTPEQFKGRCRRNAEFRALHHHVFIPETTAQLVMEAGFSIVRQDVQAFHIVTLARKSQ